MSNSVIETAVDLTEKERREAANEYPGPTEFVHLHNHTLFSPLDGIATPEEYFSAASHLGQPAFSITDHGSIAAVPDAYWAAKKNKVKFIPGCEIYFQQKHLELVERRKDDTFKIKEIRADYSKDTFGIEDMEKEEEYSDFRRNRHLSVMAMDMVGYRNLIHMTTEAWKIGFYYKPRVWFEQIEKYHQGLIVLSGCLNGPVCHALRKSAFWGDVAKKKVTEVQRTLSGKKKKITLNISSQDAEARKKMYFAEAVQWIRRFRSLLGDRYYLELQMPGEEIPFGKEAFRQIAFLSGKLGVPGVITNDCLELDFPILMGDGTFKAIGEVSIGDEVITHTGAKKKVVAKEIRKRKPNEKMMRINNIPWSMTENHPLYLDGVNKEDSRAKYRPCSAKLGKIEFGKGITHIDTKQYVNPKSGTKIVNGFWRTSSPKSNLINIPEKLKLDNELLWVIGQYIAEGFKDKYRISFATHKDHTVINRRIIDYFQQFGLSPDYNEKRTNSENGAVIRICSTIFADLLSTWCGKLAHNKHLPPFWMDLSAGQFKTMLTGYIAGDGDILLGKTGRGFHWASTSWQLTGQLQVAIASLGGYAKPYYKQEKLYESGRIDKCQYHGTSSQLSTAIIEGREHPISHNALKVYSPNQMTAPIAWTDANDVDLVCDIEVEDDHTFVLWGNICVNNCHYLTRQDFKVQKCMMAIDQGLTINDPNLFHVNSDEQFFKSRAQLRKTFVEGGYDKFVSMKKFEEFCDNTVKIGERCEGFRPDLGPKLPNIEDADNKLRTLVTEELKSRGLHDKPDQYKVDGRTVTYRQQAALETERYVEKGFASYFLIIRDLIQFSKKKEWDIGPGRGSAGGSLVCYLLGIHSIDPLAWGLSSVRFMGDSRGGHMLRVKME